MTNAAWLKQHLQPYGWDIVVVDIRWYKSKYGDQLDRCGRFLPATNRFPDVVNGEGFGPLADRIHAMGLRFGIHIMRGIPRQAVEQNTPIADSRFTAREAVRPEGDPNRECSWNNDMYGVDATTEAGEAWYASLAQQYAAWGIDYIKCDDMSSLHRGVMYDPVELEALSTHLARSGRSIILSLSPGETPVNCGPHIKRFANLWRISNDFWDRWGCLDHNFDLFAAWLPEAGPGHWPDGDMAPLGHIALRSGDSPPNRWTRFTQDEQMTLISLLAIAPSPLMLGMNLPDNDEWTTALLTNPEVLEVNQDSLGAAARRMTGPPVPAETWMKQLADGAFAVGLFNRSGQPVHVKFPWRNLGFGSVPEVRDLWSRRTLPRFETFVVDLAPHGCTLLRVK
jgi:hypothetical protein